MKNLGRSLAVLAAAAALLVSCGDSALVSLKTDALQVDISATGQLTSIKDLTSGTEYMPQGQTAPLLALRVDTVWFEPTAAQWDAAAGQMVLSYDGNRTADLKIEQKEGYVTLEILGVQSPDSVDIALWGPYPTTISRTVGECVGVVRDSLFAFGIRALNPKTIGGYPSTEDDIDPAFDIFATNSLVDVADSVKILYRGQAAKHTDFGSVVQAYVRNRYRDRVEPMWGHDYYTMPAYNDGGLVGSKIALFGCPEPQALDYIEKVVLGEGLPHPMIGGEWGKRTPEAAAAYIIYPFNEKNIDQAIEFTKRTGLKYLYHAGPFSEWGHFALNPGEFPSGYAGLKACVEKANAAGIDLGVHTLSNFTTTNDRYVTPVPDRRLAAVGNSVLAAAVDASVKEIEIADPKFFNQMKNNSLHGVRVGDELIRYEKVSESAPWKLLNCQRGAWGTQAAAHAAGDTIVKLMDHGYAVFLTDIDLTKEEARNIARVFNETGIMQISFDGLEGAWSTGLGQYGLSMMIKEWYDNLEPKYRNCINDASMTTHYNWTMFTRMNWGEPWYAGFRESQLNLRLMNQDFYRRNLIPCMLGWFTYGAETSIEDVNWLLARSAAFDAGYTLVTNGDAVARNGASDQIIEAIRIWENARMAQAFPAELKREMEHIANEYALEEVSADSWNLYPFALQRFEHKNITRQPGEPVVAKWAFNNTNGRQPVRFLLRTDDESVSDITLSVGGYSTVSFPGKLAKGEWLKYDGGAEAQVFDRNWQVIRTIPVDSSLLMVDPGEVTLTFACKFASQDPERKVSAEVKTRGEAQLLTATRKR